MQFPVLLAIAMTIIKLQGPSWDVTGLNLEIPYFEHVQVYVPCLRVRKPLFGLNSRFENLIICSHVNTILIETRKEEFNKNTCWSHNKEGDSKDKMIVVVTNLEYFFINGIHIHIVVLVVCVGFLIIFIIQ